MIDLTKYCAPESELRDYLKKPFECDGYFCASDGAIIIMTKDWNGDLGICPDYDKIHKIVDVINATYKGYTTLDDVEEPEKEYCKECGGSGRMGRCPDCEGAGEVECDLGHLHDCNNCRGDGVVKGGDDVDCLDCQGNGWEYVNYGIVPVLGGYMNYKYVAILNDLGAKIVQSDKNDPRSLYVFRFQGGRGGVMPMRK